MLIKLLKEYIDRYDSEEEKCRVFRELILTYILKSLRIRILGCGQITKVHIGSNEVEALDVQKYAIKFFPKIRLRYVDMLHLLYAHTISGNGIRFLTTDKHFRDFADQIKDELKIEVICIGSDP